MAEEEKQLTDGQPDGQQEITFTYLKSNLFRVIHADGAWGGVSPRGDIHISFYNERAAIPDVSHVIVSHRTKQAVKPEQFRATSEFVREVEVDIVVDLGTAMSLRDWLNDKIDNLATLIREYQAQQEKVGKDASTDEH